jgi:exodeoxyribonuclease VII large subunit
VSPLATLDRGYAIVSRAEDGGLLRDTAAAPIGTRIVARLGRGRLEAVVTGTAPADPPETP